MGGTDLLRAPTAFGGRLLELGVCAALATGAASAAAAPSRADDLQALERAVSEVSQLLADAHFRTARSVAEASLEQASRREGAEAGLTARRARLHVLLATAQVALQDDEAAHDSLRRALELDPALVLDPRRAQGAARREGAGPPP